VGGRKFVAGLRFSNARPTTQAPPWGSIYLDYSEEILARLEKCFDDPPTRDRHRLVLLRGKGRKQRRGPVWPETVRLRRQLLEETGIDEAGRKAFFATTGDELSHGSETSRIQVALAMEVPVS